MKYLSIQVLTREMIRQFRNLYKPGRVKIPAELKQYHVDFGLGEQFFDPKHGEEHAVVRMKSLEEFSTEIITKMAEKLNTAMPQGLEIIITDLECPVGVEATAERFGFVAMRGIIAWDIATAQEILRFDIRALEGTKL